MKKILIGIGVITMLFGVIWADNAFKTMRVNARNAQYNENIENLFRALQKFKEQTGTYPIGGNIEVVKALQGHNPKNVIVIVGNKTPVNEKGEFVDPWGTALRFYFSDNGIMIRSAGPNRRFDDSTAMDSDDYYRSN